MAVGEGGGLTRNRGGQGASGGGGGGGVVPDRVDLQKKTCGRDGGFSERGCPTKNHVRWRGGKGKGEPGAQLEDGSPRWGAGVRGSGSEDNKMCARQYLRGC